ncbi:hypothetical protein ACIGKQ_23450 [Gordonia sp. NPDC062954]|uniref:hypothetical protein n=1 Tax=Gordonia sp. NPDC062954 TaxID=3364003 RepID=UPI0037C8C98F
MTLAEQIDSLRLRAVAANDEEKIRTRTGEFTTITGRIDMATAKADRVEVARDVLHSAGVAQEDYVELRRAALALVTDLITAVESLNVDAKLDAVKMQAKTVEQFFKNSELWAIAAWKNYLPTEVPAVDDDLLDALQYGGVDVEVIRLDIERAKSAILALSNKDLPQSGDIERLQDALALLGSSGERIGSLVNPTIADVVVRVQSDDGVPFSELTPDVVVELNRLNILHRFRVVLR